MSYRCGIGPGLEHVLGPPGPPHIRCDGCGLVLEARTRSGGPPAWLMKRKAPPGWKLIRHDGPDGFFKREDYCPECRVAPEVKP